MIIRLRPGSASVSTQPGDSLEWNCRRKRANSVSFWAHQPAGPWPQPRGFSTAGTSCVSKIHSDSPSLESLSYFPDWGNYLSHPHPTSFLFLHYLLKNSSIFPLFFKKDFPSSFPLSLFLLFFCLYMTLPIRSSSRSLTQPCEESFPVPRAVVPMRPSAGPPQSRASSL